METRPNPWIQALRRSHENLAGLVGPLDIDQLRGRSYDTDWSIAQVVSHLGSQAEIFGLFLDAGLSGQAAPGQDVFPSIWEAWNSRSPQAQAADGLQADREVIERFESLDAEGRARFHLELFGMDLDATDLARMRLNEHAIHTWDVAVALDQEAKVAPDAVDLLVDGLEQLVARAGKPDGIKRQMKIRTDDPERRFVLESGDTVTLAVSEGDRDRSELRLPAEALVRLVYGRLDPAHTPPVETRGVDLDELRQMFPGF